jgi:hypothetical protein
MIKRTMAVALAVVCVSAPAFAATDAECAAMWTKVNASNSPTLTEAESARYWAAIRVHDYKLKTKAAADGKMTRDTYIEACKADVYAPRKAEAGAPLKGSNSFTEGQAKDRAMAHGFSNVSSLKKDSDGIWRGTGTWDGKPSQVAVDYKGNVVALPSQ